MGFGELSGWRIYPYTRRVTHPNSVGTEVLVLLTLPALTLCISSSLSLIMHVSMLSHFSHVQLFATLWTVPCQVPLSMRFSRQKYWSGLPCPPPGDHPNPGIKLAPPVAPALKVDSLSLGYQESPSFIISFNKFCSLSVSLNSVSCSNKLIRPKKEVVGISCL